MVHTWVLSSNGQAGRSANASIDKNRHYAATGAVRTQNAGAPAAAGWKLLRVILFAAILVILFTGITLVRSFADESVEAPVSAQEKIVFADTGDTLWGIAEDVKREGLDTREAVHRIMERNGLVSSSLHSGDRLVIPANVLEP